MKRKILKLRNDIIEQSFVYANERIVLLDDILDLFDKLLGGNCEINEKSIKDTERK